MNSPAPADLVRARRELPGVVRRQLGPYFSVTRGGTFDGERETWSVDAAVPVAIDVGADRPTLIQFFQIPRVGSALLSKRGERFVPSIPDRGDLSEAVQANFRGLVDKTETKLMESVQERFVRIPQVANALNPIIEILLGLEHGNHVSLRDVIASRKSEAKAKKYLNLLVSLNYATLEGREIVPGPKFREAQSAIADREKLHVKILANVSTAGYGYLRDYMHVTLLVPFVRSSNSYYLPSTYARENIRLSQGDILSNYERFYNTPRNPLKFGSHLKALVKANILEFNEHSGKYSGESEILDSFAKRLENFA